MGAIALALALAFGLGGRDVAARLLETGYAKGQAVKDDVARDVRVGVDRGKQQAHDIGEPDLGGSRTAP